MTGSPRLSPREWATGRLWLPRAILLAFLAYTGVRHLRDPMYTSIFSGITLAIHEIGHVLFGFLGETPSLYGGSLAQLLAPIAVALILRKQGDWFGVAVAGCWLAFSLCNLATYIADARAQQLELVGLTDDPDHDWTTILARWSLMTSDLAIARATRFVAFITLSVSLWFGAWLCVVMFKSPKRDPATS